jgi:hypothetical protein
MCPVTYSKIVALAVSIGSAPAQVVSSVLAPGFAGIYQINVQIPASAPVGDDVPITLSVAGSTTSSATISIQDQTLYNCPAFEVTLGKKRPNRRIRRLNAEYSCRC